MKHVSPELAAVLHIFNHDEELRTKALPYVNVETQCIDWRAIFRSRLGAGHKAAVRWAYTLWRNGPGPYTPFWDAYSMDAGLRRAVIQAIAIRWSLHIDTVRGLHIA